MAIQLDGDDDRAPPRAEQAPIVFAFRKIVLTQKTSDGVEWKIGKILDALWELWDERPKALGRKLDYCDANGGEFYQPIDRIKRGVTRSVHSNRLFGLLRKFVNTFGLPGRVVPLGQDVRLLHDAAKCLSSFVYSGRDAILHVADFRQPMYPTPIEKLVSGESQNKDVVFELSEMHRREDGGLRRLLTSKIVAIRFASGVGDLLNRYDEHYWPLVSFDPATADYEIGFYLRNLSVAILRSVTVTEYGQVLYRSGVPDPEPVAARNARLLSFSIDFSDAVSVREKATFQAGSEEFERQYALRLEPKEEYLDLAARLLNFLDIR